MQTADRRGAGLICSSGSVFLINASVNVLRNAIKYFFVCNKLQLLHFMVNAHFFPPLNLSS